MQYSQLVVRATTVYRRSSIDKEILVCQYSFSFSINIDLSFSYLSVCGFVHQDHIDLIVNVEEQVVSNVYVRLLSNYVVRLHQE